MKSLLDQLDDLKRQMELYRAIPGHIRRQILGSSLAGESVSDSVKHFLDGISSQITDPANLSRLYDNISNLAPITAVTGLIAEVNEYHFDSVHIQHDGSVIVDGESATSAELQEAITELLDQPGNFLAYLGDHFADFSKPVRFIVSWFLKNMLGVLSIILALYLDNGTGTQMREAQEHLQQQITKDGDLTRQELRAALKEMSRIPQDLSQLRVVPNPIKIKDQPFAHANTVDHIPVGTVVLFVEKTSLMDFNPIQFS
jgi:hypothetical protein